VSFEAFGVQAAITLGDPGLETHIQAILPPGWSPSGAGEGSGQFGLREVDAGSYEVTVGGAPWLEHATLDLALSMLDAQIRMFIAATARDWIFVHAGVVAQADRALVIPGESFSGKTTLVSALVEAGATYYSDEYAVLDRDGRVHPYTRRLSIRGGDGTPTQERHVAELGGVEARDSAEIGTVIVTRYRRGVDWEPKRMSTGAGALALMANTVPAQERPQESLRVLGRAVAKATVLESDRGEAGPVAAALLADLAAAVVR
jgi:hypothetical protein